MDKDSIKEKLTIEQIKEFLDNNCGESYLKDSNTLISRTICHNKNCEGSHKLYYYDNTHLFICYTECNSSFDIFELAIKIEKINTGREMPLQEAVNYIANYFGIHQFEFYDKSNNNDKTLLDWKVFKKHQNISTSEYKEQKAELKIFDNKILEFFPKPRITLWEREGISKEVMLKRNICYDPTYQGIIIPHYDINNNLIGIRERTLVKEKEIRGKYFPAVILGQMYNHPLSFNLYNLNNSKDNIKKYKKAIVFESEKATMQYATMFGEENDISVACCGSSLINYQVKLLLDLKVREIIIGFDKQFQKIGDDEFKKWVRKLTAIHNKYKKYVNISFLFDKEDNLLGYKEAPTDCGKEIFLKLYNNRIFL